MNASAELAGRTPWGVARRAADLVEVLLRGGSRREVTAVLRAHGERGRLDLDEAALAKLREVAGELHAVFGAADTDAAAARLNELLADRANPPRLTTHAGQYGWHLHVDSRDDAPWDEWLLTSSCLALAMLLAESQTPPVGLCASPSCGRPFVRAGGGSPRRYCSTRCATRERVAAHRRARTTEPGRGR